MTRPTKLDDAAVKAFLDGAKDWAREGDQIVRTYRFPDFSSAYAFGARVALACEKHDHHPELTIGWGHATVRFTTHDVRGLSDRDVTLAKVCDAFYSA